MMDLNGQGKQRREAYAEKLKDPRWQKKRLEIFQRDKWACQRCGDTTVMLSVHHLCYHPGKDPWESPDEELQTLCETCHSHETRNIKEARSEILHALRRWPWETEDLHMLVLFLSTVQDFHRRHGLMREAVIIKAHEYVEKVFSGAGEIEASRAAREQEQRALWLVAL